MNRSRLLMIGLVALALGAFISYSIYRNLQTRTGANAAPGEDVLVATRDLEVGNKVEERDIKAVHFPSADLPAGCFHIRSKLVGRGVISPIARGEFYLPSKLAGENAGYGLPALIPPGMRAVSVRVNEVVAVANFVLPGTRVDVLLTGNPSGAQQQQTTTVLENVLVIATGQKMERNTSGNPQTASVITLLVSPDDAQKLTLATTQGRIQLSLRNPLDSKAEDIASVRTDSLYKIPTTPPATHTKVVRAKPAAIPAPPAYTVEMIRGEKRDVTKF